MARIMILGMSDTGKTSIVTCRNGVTMRYFRPEETRIIETYVFDKGEYKDITTYIIDCPGKMSTAFIEKHLPQTHAVLLVYNRLSKESWDYIFDYLEPVVKKFPHLNVNLVATFADIELGSRRNFIESGPLEARKRRWTYFDITYKKPHIISQMFHQIETNLRDSGNFDVAIRKEREECGGFFCCNKR